MGRDVWTVGGALAVTLWLSRVFGAAPLRLQAHGATVHARVSKAYALYGVVFVTLLNILVITGVLLDITWNVDEPSRMVRGGTNTDFIMWLMNMSVTQSLVTIAAYSGHNRMTSMVYHFNQLKQATPSTQGNNEMKQKREKKRTAICIVLLTLQFVIVINDFVYSLKNATKWDKDVLVTSLYGAYYLCFFIGVVVGAQIVFLIYGIHAAMESLNEELERILSNVQETRPLDKAEESSLRRIAMLYDAICDIVGYFNKDDGSLVLLKFTACNVYLMYTAYYFYNTLVHFSASFHFYFDMTTHFLWCSAHIIGMVVLVEPCHQTIQEVDKFRVLLTDLMCRTQPSGAPSALCVDVLYKQLALDTLAFSPLGVCSLTRSLFTASISTLTTCLVIVVQYRLGNVVKNEK